MANFPRLRSITVLVPMTPQQRPVFLNLIRIRLPITGWVSIMHRISGALLFLAIPFFVYLLSLSMADEAGFARSRAIIDSTSFKLLSFALLWALLNHLFAGIRILLLDLHQGVDISSARKTAVMVLAGGLLTAVACGLVLGLSI